MTTQTAPTPTTSNTAAEQLPAFTVDYRDMAAACKALAIVAGGKRHVQPIVSRVHVRVRDNVDEVELTAFDWETAVQVVLPATACTPGVALMEQETVAKSLTAAVKGMRKRDMDALVVSLRPDTEGESLALEVAGYVLPAVLGTLYPLEDYPVTPAVAPGSHVIDRELFTRAALNVAHAADSGGTRPTLESVKLDLGPARLAMVATDTYRMAEAVLPADGGTTASAIVPVGVLRKILPHLDGEQLRLGVDATDSLTWVTVAGDRVSMTCRGVDAKYPKVSTILDRTPTRTVIAQRDKLHTAADRCAALCKNLLTKPIARLSVDGEAITLAPHDETLRTPVTAPKVAVELDGDPEPMQIGFNGQFLLEALATFGGERVCIGLETDRKPAVLVDPDMLGYRIVLMPVRFAG